MTAILPAILSVESIRTLETRNADAPLMERAGRAAAEDARRMIGDRGGPVVILCGPGNNGGDGFVVARWLRRWFHDVDVVFSSDPARLPPDAAGAFAAYRAEGGTISTEPAPGRPALVVDALFGIGLGRGLEPPYAGLVEWANRSGAPILALDVPSGLDGSTGLARATTVRATCTASFIALKPGLLTGDGPDHCGTVHVHTLGLDAQPIATGHRLDWLALAAALPPVLARHTRNVNKGSFGTLGILGGTEGMAGALILAGRAALRTGAGKVWLGFLMADPPRYDAGMPELMLRRAGIVLEAQPDAVVIGPGLGQNDAAHALLVRALALEVPVVLDADALNLIAHDAELLAAVQRRAAPTLVTPHPGEAARLLGEDVAAVQADRIRAAGELARRLGASVVLKGAGSVLAYPGDSIDINGSGGPALATAGSGDVLCGILGALLVQGIDAPTALRFAVCLHGAAADLLVERGVGPLGVTASELPDAARELLNAAARSARGSTP